MPRFVIEYEFELDTGDLPYNTVAEMILNAEKDGTCHGAYEGVWAFADPKCVRVAALDES